MIFVVLLGVLLAVGVIVGTLQLTFWQWLAIVFAGLCFVFVSREQRR